MSETELLRKGSIAKSLLVQTILELRKEKEEGYRRSMTGELENILSQKPDPLLKKMETITDTVGSLKSRIDHLQEECAELKRIRTLETEDICKEAAKRVHRRKYLIISGIPEQTSDSVSERKKADTKAVEDVAEVLGVDDVDN